MRKKQEEYQPVIVIVTIFFFVVIIREQIHQTLICFFCFVSNSEIKHQELFISIIRQVADGGWCRYLTPFEEWGRGGTLDPIVGSRLKVWIKNGKSISKMARQRCLYAG